MKMPSEFETRRKEERDEYEAERKKDHEPAIAAKYEQFQNICSARNEELQKLIVSANEAHGRGIIKLRSAIEDYREAGKFLNAAKKIVGHGFWKTWFDKNKSKFYFSYRTSNVYKQLDDDWNRIEEIFGENKPCIAKILTALKYKPKVSDDDAIGKILNAREKDNADVLAQEKHSILSGYAGLITSLDLSVVHAISDTRVLDDLVERTRKSIAADYERTAAMFAKYEDELFAIEDAKDGVDVLTKAEKRPCKLRLLERAAQLENLTPLEMKMIREKLGKQLYSHNPELANKAFAEMQSELGLETADSESKQEKTARKVLAKLYYQPVENDPAESERIAQEFLSDPELESDFIGASVRASRERKEVSLEELIIELSPRSPLTEKQKRVMRKTMKYQWD